MNVLAIIPARGGSRGIPRKNLVDIEGRPLVSYSIEHALNTKLINRVIVSTDDAEIAEVSRKWGAEIPFIRPSELAEDHVLDLPVFQHALHFLKETEDYECSIVVHLRPTAPYRKSKWIDEAVEFLQKNSAADSVRSVSKPTQHPFRVFEIETAGYLDPIMKDRHPTPYLLRRQDLPKMYYYNCVIDVTRPDTIWQKNSMTGDRIYPYIMEPDDAIDIDSIRDLEFARFLFATRWRRKP